MITVISYIISLSSCFIRNKNCINRLESRHILRSSSSSSSSSPIATLDDRTLWELKLLLRKDGSPGDAVSAIARVRFIESRGYEPPQGVVFVEDDLNGLIKVNDKGLTSNFKLSEDINDRKDGLWIWGLFEEPKYPYLYFTLNVYDTVFVGEEEKKIYGEGVPGDKFFVRFDHIRDERGSVILSNGQITFQKEELVKVDPLGIGGKINGGDIENAGLITIQPIFK